MIAFMRPPPRKSDIAICAVRSVSSPAKRATQYAAACTREPQPWLLDAPLSRGMTATYAEPNKGRGQRAYALACSLRQACRSTARSGMVMRKVAPMVPSTSLISPPCARTSSAAMARPRPVPPVRVEAWNASNRCSRAFSRQARPGVGNLDHRHRALAPAGDADLVARRDRWARGFPAPARRCARRSSARAGTARGRRRPPCRVRSSRSSGCRIPAGRRATRALPRPAPRTAPACGPAATRCAAP